MVDIIDSHTKKVVDKEVILDDLTKIFHDSSVADRYVEDLSKNPIRPLTKDERAIFNAAILKARDWVPAFRDALAILHPYMDATASTAYTDVYARVGLSYWFFYVIDNEHDRATIILHECMHVLNQHFLRAENCGMKNSDKAGYYTNICGDMEINTTLTAMPRTESFIKDFVIPDNYGFPKFKTMEQYYEYLKEYEKNHSDPDEDGNSGDGSGESGSSGENSESNGSSSGSGDGDNENSGISADDIIKNAEGKGGNSAVSKGKSCDDSSDERSEQADEAGIDKTSVTQQNIARNNTKARIVDELNNPGIGSGTSNDFLKLSLKFLNPPKVDWRKIFRQAISTVYSSTMTGKSYSSYKRVNRRSPGNIIFPGTIDYNPTMMCGLDTSGSMGQADFRDFLSELDKLLKSVARDKDGVKFFTIDTKIHQVDSIKSVQQINIHGGGGTDMTPAFEYVNSIPHKKRPNIFILGTDGGVVWNNVIRELRKATYQTIILITSNYGMQQVTKELKDLAIVIDVSSQNNN